MMPLFEVREGVKKTIESLTAVIPTLDPPPMFDRLRFFLGLFLNLLGCWLQSETDFVKISSCHSKTPVEFLHMESATLKVRHILTINRMMFHHHIFTTNEDETLMKMYQKQKSDPTKDDWYELLQTDFQLLVYKLVMRKSKLFQSMNIKRKSNPWFKKQLLIIFLNKKTTL